jgi:membrane-associated phospholipid phosphatase
MIHRRQARRSAMQSALAGCLLLILAALVGAYLASHPGPDVLDRWVSSRISARYHSGLLVAIAKVGDPPVVGIAGIVGALVLVRSDGRRAAACIIGPLLGGVLTEYVLKPLVDPRAGGLTFPSGHTDGVSALVVVAMLALSRAWRWGVVSLGAVLELASCYAVVALGWHSPTDALAGLAVGTGSVLLADGVLHSF